MRYDSIYYIVFPHSLSVVHAIVGCVREIRAENSVLACLNQFRGVAYSRDHGFQASSSEFNNYTRVSLLINFI